MGVEIKYICDKCRHSGSPDDENGRKFFNLRIAVQRARYDRDLGKFEDLTALWCDHCVAKAGFRKIVTVPEPKVRITMEELVKELIKEART